MSDDTGVTARNALCVGVELINGQTKLPSRSSYAAVGFDIHANEDVIIEPGDWHAVATGLKFAGFFPDGVFPNAFPDGVFPNASNLELQIRPRSGLAVKHGVTVLNSPGTIDPDYRGEIKVPLINHGKGAFKINKGDRIAQAVIASHLANAAHWVRAESKDDSQRGEGGFGSTGV